MQNILSVLLQFYRVFPELRPCELVITGESYGGLYTPNLALLINEHNKAAPPDPQQQITLRGLAVGDPAINWERQMPTYADMMYGMGVLMVDEREELRAVMAKSVEQMSKGDCPAAFKSWNAVWDDDGGIGPTMSPTAMSWYTQKTGDKNTANILMGNGPTGFEDIFGFWAKSEATAAFHVDGVAPPSNATTNGLKLYDSFVASGDWCANSSWIYARLMTDYGLDLMIYSSTADPLLGPPTTEAGVYAIFDDAAAHNPAAGAEIKAGFAKAKKQVQPFVAVVCSLVCLC